MQKQSEEIQGSRVFLGHRRTDCGWNVMATNSQQLSGAFVTDTDQVISGTGEILSIKYMFSNIKDLHLYTTETTELRMFNHWSHAACFP